MWMIVIWIIHHCHVMIHHCHVIRIHFHEIIVHCHVIKINYHVVHCHVTKPVDSCSHSNLDHFQVCNKDGGSGLAEEKWLRFAGDGSCRWALGNSSSVCPSENKATPHYEGDSGKETQQSKSFSEQGTHRSLVVE